MKLVKHRVQLDLPKLLEEEMPWMRSFFHDGNELKERLYQHYKFHLDNQRAMPFYVLNQKAVEHIHDVSDRAYRVMVKALEWAFANREEAMPYFNCEMLRSKAGRAFFDYAAWTFSKTNPLGMSLYSRFDLAFDPVKDQVTGIYELNGDTPTMLFESTVLQSHLLTQHYDLEWQSNDWWFNIGDSLTGKRLDASNKVGVVFDGSYSDDSATCEIIAAALEEHVNTMMVDITALQYEDLQPQKPFYAYDQQLDGMFVLVPWETMVMEHPKMIFDWDRWCNNVAVWEPAWKWFLSNKGLMALITDLSSRGKLDTEGLPFLYTSLSELAVEGTAYVEKPKVGRMSKNITIYSTCGREVQRTDGEYATEEPVYQKYCEPGRINGDRNFIIGSWMAGVADQELGHRAISSGIAIREFAGAACGWDDENFIPHVVID